MEYFDMLEMKAKETIKKFIDQEDEMPLISFSGGKDSTILLHLARQIYPNIEGVFCNTGNEYIEIIKFVKQFDNITTVYPKYSFKEIIDKYGYPIVSKEQSRYIHDVRNINVSNKTKNARLGNGNFSLSKKWRYLIDSDIKISDKCCYYLKKAPLKRYAGKRKYITGERCAESNLRKQRYHTCILPNKCIPLRLWTNDMIDWYMDKYNIQLSKIYDTEERTGCKLCLYGIHMEKGINKIERLKYIEPATYKYALNELNYRHVCKLINVNIGDD